MFTLSHKQTYMTTGTINQVSLGDFNGDGLSDLIITTFSIPLQNKSHPILVFENTGTAFKNVTSTVINGSAGSVHARQILVGDLNGDHRMDFYIAGHGYDVKPFPGEQSSLLLSGSTITNATTNLVQQISYNHSAALADINQDGRLDILSGDNYSSGPYLNINNKEGFVYQDIPGTKRGQTYAFLDANQDNILDLYVSNTSGQNSTILFGHNGSFKDIGYKIPQGPLGFEDMDSQVLDLNHDGLQDLLISSYNAKDFTGIFTRALIQQRDGTFIDKTLTYVPYNDLNSSSWRERIILRDLDGNGLIDAVVQYAGQDIKGPPPEIWINNGSGFDVKQISDNLNLYSRVAVGNLDHNGTPDIVVVNGNNISTFLNNNENPHMMGTTSNDLIEGNGFGNTIYGLSGNDTIVSNGGQDTIDGGLGIDTVVLKPDEYSYKLVDGLLSISNFFEIIVLKNVEQISIGNKTTKIVDLFQTNQKSVYRLYDSEQNTHFYTGDQNTATEYMAVGFNFEGVAFKYDDLNSQDVYRFYNKKTNSVFYTIDNNEKDNIIKNLNNFEFQGSDFKSYVNKVSGTQEVYRFYNKLSDSHFYTVDENEKINVLNNNDFTYEGIAFWGLL